MLLGMESTVVPGRGSTVVLGRGSTVVLGRGSTVVLGVSATRSFMWTLAAVKRTIHAPVAKVGAWLKGFAAFNGPPVKREVLAV